MVMEILKVEHQTQIAAALNAPGNQNIYWQHQLSTKSLGGYSPNDGTVLSTVTDQAVIFQPATTEAAVLKWAPMPIVRDFTDGAGHGVIVATDQLFYFFDTVGFGAPVAFWMRIWYRFKEVTLEEYIGIVQSQQ